MKWLLQTYLMNLGFIPLFQNSVFIRNASFPNNIHIPNTGENMIWLISWAVNIKGIWAQDDKTTKKKIKSLREPQKHSLTSVCFPDITPMAYTGAWDTTTVSVHKWKETENDGPMWSRPFKASYVCYFELGWMRSRGIFALTVLPWWLQEPRH